MLNLSDETEVETAIDEIEDKDEREDEDEENIDDETIEKAKNHLPELNAITVFLPSNIKSKRNINQANKIELELRKGQANDALEGLKKFFGI